MKRTTSLFLLLFVAALSLALILSAKPAAPESRRFDFDYRARIPAPPTGAKKLRVWIPVPQSDANQEISGLRIKSPVPYQLHQDPEYHNSYIYLETVPAAQPKPIEVRLHFQVERRENRVALEPGVARRAVAPAAPAELARSLRPDRLVPTTGMLAELAGQQTRGLTQPLDKARAIYNYVVSTMKYDKSGVGWGRGDAIYACNVHKGNCTDFHALFIGMMRAAGIPARFEIGFPLPRDQHDGEIPGYHCWALFYLDGFGWVPVDASEAWKDLSRREYFFGAHDANRVLFTHGRDIRFNPAQDGEPVNYFIYPYAELDGKALAGIESKFFFHDLPARPQ